MTNSFATFHPFHGGYEIEKLEDSSEIESPGFFVFDYGLIEKIKKYVLDYRLIEKINKITRSITD